MLSQIVLCFSKWFKHCIDMMHYDIVLSLMRSLMSNGLLALTVLHCVTV